MAAPPVPSCSQCHLVPSKYTCPRCSAKTCSAGCIKLHKSLTPCSGVRDKTAYVPMNKYGYGALMDDYTYLEDGRRRIQEWGGELGGGKTAEKEGAGVVGRSKRFNGLQGELGRRGIRLEYLPDGMERARNNQSGYQSKNNTVSLSLEFIWSSFHPSPPTPSKQTIPRVPLTPETTLLSLLPLLSKSFSPDPTTPLIFTIAIPPRPSSSTSLTNAKAYYPVLDAAIPLGEALKGKTFLEYPTVEIYPEEIWNRLVGEGRVVISEMVLEEEVPKRERVEVREEVGGRVRDDGWGARAGRAAAVVEGEESPSMDPPAQGLASSEARPTVSCLPISNGAGPKPAGLSALLSGYDSADFSEED